MAAPILRDIKVRFPNMTVELTVDLGANLSKALFDHDLDLALQSGPFNRSTSFALPLSQSPHVWIATPDLAPAAPLTAADLTRHPILAHARSTASFRQLEDHLRPLGGARLVPGSNLASCLQMAMYGLGIACLPRALLTAAPAHGSLLELDYPWHPEGLQFHARHDLDPAAIHITEAALIAQRLSLPDDTIS